MPTGSDDDVSSINHDGSADLAMELTNRLSDARTGGKDMTRAVRMVRMALLRVAVMLAGCASSEEWVKPGVSDTQRDRDAAECLFASADIVPTAQGPQRRLNQDRYRRCMSERGYAVKKAGE